MSLDLKPFFKKLFNSAPKQLKATTLKDIQIEIADLLDTYLGHFDNGRIYMGTDTALFPYELADLIDMTESDVEDYMNSISTLALSSQAYYADVKIQNNIEWVRGGMQSVLHDLLTQDISNFVFPINIVFTPDLYTCIIQAHLFYKEDILYIEFKLKELKGNSDENKIPKKYTGYYASVDGSMDANVVINKFNLNFARGNVIKYVIRAGKKDSSKEIEDLQKAITYLNMEIDRIKEASETE